jgi:alkylation response protein AidB-like acyl-CoA dehydrogenase
LLLQAVLGGGLVASVSSLDREDILKGIIESRERIAVGLHEPRGRADVFNCETRAARAGDGWTIDGTKTLVLGAEGASRLIVLARIEDRGDDPRTGLGLFLCDAKSGNSEWRHYRLRDDTPASDVILKGVVLADEALIAGPDVVVGVLERVLAATRLCLAAEASGLMQSILSGTATYANQRQQFGQAIGAFQVIQHRLADLAVMADQSAALVSRIAKHTAIVADINTAYQSVAEMGMTAAKTAIQLHGGYGMTEDLPYGQALRRMMTIALLFRVPAGV